MAEYMCFNVFIPELASLPPRKACIERCFEVTSTWLPGPASMLVLNWRQGKEELIPWPGDDLIWDRSLSGDEQITIYSKGRYLDNPRGSVAVYEGNRYAMYVVSVDMALTLSTPIADIKAYIVRLFNTFSTYASVLVAVGSELDLDPQVFDIKTALREAAASVQNAFWIAINKSFLSELPADFSSVKEFDSAVLLERSDSVSALGL